MKPLVSIIVPIYNNEDDIKTCINAILNQTYSNLQIVLVDDGSTDNTYQVCKSFDDERITLVKKENGGASSARNFGLKYAEGEYIYFADSDDHLVPEAISCLVEVIQQENVDCIYFEANNYTDDSALVIKEGGLLQKTTYPIMSGNELIPQLLRNKDFHAAPFLYFVRASKYEDLRFEEGIMFEDELFVFQMLRKCEKVACLRKVLYQRKVRAGSVMTSTGKGLFRIDSITRVFTKIYEMYKQNPQDEVVKQYLSRIGVIWFSYWKQLNQNEKTQKKDTYDKIRTYILKSKGFGSKELIVRCYGYYPWILCILPSRCLRKIRLRSLK